MNRNSAIIAGLALILGVAVVLIVEGKRQTSYTESPPASVSSGMSSEPNPPPPPPEATTSYPQSEVKEFTVTGKNFSFSPDTLTVKKGDTVKIIFKNEGGVHDFEIEEFNVETKRINGGQQDTVQFVADKAGSFEYFCSVGNHRAMGMKGTLIVQ